MGNVNKWIFLFLCVMGISFNAFAQDENSMSTKRFSYSGALSFMPDGGGSGIALGFGFLLSHNEIRDIRNHISINAPHIHDYNGVDNIILNLNEKISVGSITQKGLFRPYGFIEGGIGFYGTETKELFKTPLAYSFGTGFGLDIFIHDTTSFLIEGGIDEHILDTEWIFMLKMTIGTRVYF
jgi:hypothetical protein